MSDLSKEEYGEIVENLKTLIEEVIVEVDGDKKTVKMGSEDALLHLTANLVSLRLKQTEEPQDVAIERAMRGVSYIASRVAEVSKERFGIDPFGILEEGKTDECNK